MSAKLTGNPGGTSDGPSGIGETVLVSHAQSALGDWLSAEELAGLTPALLTERMVALKPMAAARARATETLRHIDLDVFAALRRSGIFYYFVPKKFGGLQFDVTQYIDAIMPLGEACASTGWVTSFCMEHNWLVAHLPPEGQAEIFKSFPYVIAPGATMPPGIATPVEGGYRLTGRWKWSTGVMHADWVLLTGLERPADGGPPVVNLMALPVGQVKIIDTWDIDGMLGTGSHDVVADNVFVPASHTVDFAKIGNGASPGAIFHDSPVYRMPTSAFLALTAAIPAVGNAKGAVAFCLDYLKGRTLYGSDTKRSERPSAQIKLGHANLDATVAEMLLRGVAESLVAISKRAEPASIPERIDLRSRIAHAVDLARQATQKVAEIAGTSARFRSNPLQRALRDAQVMATHVALDIDSAVEQRGRAMLGLPPNSAIV